MTGRRTSAVDEIVAIEWFLYNRGESMVVVASEVILASFRKH